MLNKDNAFRNKTKKEIEKEVEESAAIAKKIDKVVKDAQACLNSTVFAKYKVSLKEAREGLIKIMKMNSDPDPIKFAFFCKACLSKIDAFDMLLDEIKKDAKKGQIK